MKILVAGRGFDEGEKHELGIFELDQAKALRDAGHEVRFAAMDTRSVRHRRPWGFRTYEEDGLPVFYGAVPCGGLPLDLPAAAGRLAAEKLFSRATADGWRPDIIHQHFAADFGIPAGRNGIPFIFTEHFSGHNRPLPEAEREALRKEYARADRLIAVSTALAEQMFRNTGLSARVVPNIADTALFARGRCAHEGFRFVSAGNLVETKNFDLLLRAFAPLSPECTLDIYGEGEERERLQARISELGLNGRAVLKGRVSRETLAEAYAFADCFVLPSRTETFGLSYIEAMAAGLPVIAARSGGPGDFVSGENGLLVPVDDEESLRTAMEHMFLHAADYDAAALSEYVCRKFSPEEIARQLTEIYKEVRSC